MLGLQLVLITLHGRSTISIEQERQIEFVTLNIKWSVCISVYVRQSFCEFFTFDMKKSQETKCMSIDTYNLEFDTYCGL